MSSSPSMEPRHRARANQARVAQLTGGSLPRGIFSLALPIIGSYTFLLAMDIMDGIFLGRLGSAYLAAVTLGWSIIFLMMTLGAGLGIGTVAIVSRAYGKRQFARAGRIGGQALYLGFIIAVVFGLIGWLLSPSLLVMLGADSDTLAIGLDYLRILFGGLFLLFFVFIGSATFQGAGDTMTPFWIVGFTMVLNMILDPLLIFGLAGFPRLEASGAALATVLSRAIGSIIMITALVRGRHGAHIVLDSLKPDLRIMKELFVIGFPGSIMMLLRSTSGLIITKIAAMISPVALAVLGGGGRLFGLLLFPGFGFGGAAATLVGQNLGAKKPARAEKGALLAAFYYLIYLVVCGIPVYIFAPQLSRIFNSEPEFVAVCTEFFRFMAVGSIAMSGGVVLSRALQGAGAPVWPMIMTGIGLFVVQIPLGYLLAITYGFNERGIWIGNLVGGFATAGLICWVFFRGTWKERK